MATNLEKLRSWDEGVRARAKTRRDVKYFRGYDTSVSVDAVAEEVLRVVTTPPEKYTVVTDLDSFLAARE